MKEYPEQAVYGEREVPGTQGKISVGHRYPDAGPWAFFPASPNRGDVWGEEAYSGEYDTQEEAEEAARAWVAEQEADEEFFAARRRRSEAAR